MYLGQEVDTDSCLVCVVERIIHESCNQRCLSNCATMSETTVQRALIEAIKDAYHSVLPKTPTYHSISNLLKPV